MDNTNLREAQHDLESNVMEARRQVELGREEAQEELRHHQESLGDAYDNVALAMDRVADRADKDLKDLMEGLGQLNLLLSFDGLSDFESLERVTGRVTGLLENAISDLKKIQDKDGKAWETHGMELRAAWNQFREHLDEARWLVAKDAGEVVSRLDSTLMEGYANDLQKVENASEGKVEALTSSLHQCYEQLRPWFRALLMMPTEASPKLPQEKPDTPPSGPVPTNQP